MIQLLNKCRDSKIFAERFFSEYLKVYGINFKNSYNLFKSVRF